MASIFFHSWDLFLFEEIFEFTPSIFLWWNFLSIYHFWKKKKIKHHPKNCNGYNGQKSSFGGLNFFDWKKKSMIIFPCLTFLKSQLIKIQVNDVNTQFFPFLKIKVPWSYALDRSTEHKKSYPMTYRSCNRLLTNNFPSVALSFPQVGANGDPGNLNCTDPYFDSVTTSWSLLSSLEKSDRYYQPGSLQEIASFT